MTAKYVDTEMMAARREKRAARQNELINEYKTPLICFTMNIPGAFKLSPLIETVFLYGIDALLSEFSGSLVHFEQIREATGCEAFFSINADARFIKERTTFLEETLPAGRLYDMDVLTADGGKLSRSEMRKCIVCGSPAAVCARNRTHGLPALQKAAEAILIKALCEYISNAASDALFREVHLTPKPGLVDENNSGANSDMDISLFEKSIEILKPYFYKFAEYCVSDFNKSPSDEFISRLRKLGIEAENAMLKSTGGVNTHKGAIYSLGLIVSAYALLASGKRLPTLFLSPAPGSDAALTKLLFTASRLAKRLEENAETAANAGTENPKAEAQKEGNPPASVAVEQAKAGFPAAANALKAYHKAVEFDTECPAWAYALLNIMTELPDKNVLKRGGTAGAEFVKRNAENLLKKGALLNLKDLYAFDRELTARNLNCGGCADMLAAAMLLNVITGTRGLGTLLQNKIQ